MDLEDLYDYYDSLTDRELLTLCRDNQDPICEDQSYWVIDMS